MTFDNGLIYFFVFPVVTVLVGLGLYLLAGFIDVVGDLFNG